MSVRNIDEAKQKGTINFIPLDRDEEHWKVILEDTDCMGFFEEVWPHLTMRDLSRLPSYRMPQVLWSAYGYGVVVKVKDDTRW